MDQTGRENEDDSPEYYAVKMSFLNLGKDCPDRSQLEKLRDRIRRKKEKKRTKKPIKSKLWKKKDLAYNANSFDSVIETVSYTSRF